MPRNKCLRHVWGEPGVVYYKPAGVPMHRLEEVQLGLDEYEALRLADLEGMYQDQAAEKMNVSRQTFGRIVEEARKKVADALVYGKAIRIARASDHVRMLTEEYLGRQGRGAGRGMGQGHHHRHRHGWDHVEPEKPAQT